MAWQPCLTSSPLVDTVIQHDQTNMAGFFWYLLKSDLSSVRYCKHVNLTSHVLTRNTRPCITRHPVYSLCLWFYEWKKGGEIGRKSIWVKEKERKRKVRSGNGKERQRRERKERVGKEKRWKRKEGEKERARGKKKNKEIEGKKQEKEEKRRKKRKEKGF